MAEVVLFHSVLGVRHGVLDAAERMRAMGHTVHIPNLYDDGLVFDDYKKAIAHVDAMGYRELLARTDAAVTSIPANVVYAGFSNGGASAEYLAATRPGATGCLLFASGMPLGGFAGIAEVGPWPSSVDVQVHYTKDDPFREQGALDAFSSEVRTAGASFTLHEYPGNGHLFTDRTLPAEYDEAAAELMFKRVAAFLADR
jgi:dienelactone hydrolase